MSGTDTLPPSHHNYDQHCCEQAARTTASADAIEELRAAIAKQPAGVWLWRDLLKHFTQPRFERGGGPRAFYTSGAVAKMLQAMNAEGVSSWADGGQAWGTVAAIAAWPTFKQHILDALKPAPMTLQELTAALRPAWRHSPEELTACISTGLNVLAWQGAIEALQASRREPVRYGVAAGGAVART
jgi:hypothetical protein